ncbi:MAG: zinc-binding dehydrogenase [Myxococcota bacterium]|nr:zinc-binding dehydrogenase [Myxococcota bacterium]
MKAAVMRAGEILVDEVPEPEPGPGQVLVRTLACGICGSDLHALQHADEMMKVAEESGLPRTMELDRDVVMGHEFCAEILEFGPNTLQQLNVGDRVCSVPLVFHPGGMAPVGYSNDFPGGYGERMVLTEPLLQRVPDDLPSEAASLTEPMAVGIHAVAKGNLKKGEGGLVVGCGPVGLAVIAGLRLVGAEPIVATDFSARRRELALHMGAHAAVDPGEQTAMEAWRTQAGAKTPVVFECVGVPGMLDQLMREAAPQTRIVVAGVCMETDSIRPMIGINKELNLQFVLGYSPEEFSGALRSIAEGAIDVGPLITGRVPLSGVAGAFEDLGRPDAHAKILVEPGS